MRSITAAHPKDRADIEDNFRKTVGQALGGIFVLLGAGIAYFGTLQTIRVTDQASRDLLISNQVARGVEELGSDKLVVRLGGIYALEGVMNASEQYHQPVLEALSAFVRDGTQTVTGDGPPTTDFQTALAVIGRRKALGGETNDFTNAGLPREGFPREGKPDLSNAHIPKADLLRANLSGVSLSSANLSGAVLINANLSRADLSGAHLNSAVLSGASLSDATITQAQLDQACGMFGKLDPGLTIKPCQ
jgi:hypothetical protein